AKLGTLRLDELDLTGCISLKTPPLEIQRRGVNSVLAYLHRLLTGSVECKRTKLMLLGLGGAGKTSLIEAMMNNVLQDGNKPAPNLTDGISILDWKVDIADEQNLTFSVFDFAGQVVYYNTHQFFLSNRSIYLLVWNVRLGAQHSGLDFWLNSIDCHAPSCPIFIVGSHIDQVSKFDLPIEKYKKKYPQIVGFHFVSSLDGKGIPELTKNIINTALEEKYMGEKIPKCWLEFESELHKLKREKYFLDYSEAEKIADNHGIFEQTELAQALGFLHDLGSIMYFNNQFLRDKVVINPQFMVDLLACLVSVNNNHIVDGHLWKNDVEKIWKKYNPSLHKWILKITEKFDLTFEIGDQGLHLVPCLLSEAPPDDTDWSQFEIKKVHDRQISILKPNKKESKIIYNFEYLPVGLFNRAQVRLYLMTDTRAIWKNGSILHKNNHTALITRLDNTIKVKCVGIQPENLVFLIHEVLETLIAESFSGVTFDFSFPCPDCYDNICINSGTSMFSASLVRQAMRLKAFFLQCRNMFHVVPIADLHAKMPPDSTDSYDIQLKHSVRDLKHLKQKLNTDMVILYSTKDTHNDNIIQPRQIKTDLEKNGITCWFSEAPDQVSIDSISVLLRNCSLVLFCITDNFCSDQQCVNMFNFVKLNIMKPYVLVVLGDSFEWQKSQVGALVTN
ncbi:putative serine threonine- kinase pats1, partial [Brachionus plicatilis]